MSDETQVRGRIDPGASRSSFSRGDKPTIVLIAPDEGHRRSLTRALEAQHANIVSTLSTYPNYNQLLSVTEADFDAALVELDTDSDTAFDVVESLCARKPAATVMVYSRANHPEMLMASMRAGAREYLSGAIAPNVLAEALLRAAARRAETAGKRTLGKVLVFWGAKGGSGTTTLAANFAIALRRETGGAVALLDFNPQLGDISVLLGVSPRFTITDAFTNPHRLDEEFISTLVTEHSSGVSVLAAADGYQASVPMDESTVARLVELVAMRYPYVIVDAGLNLGKCAEALFQVADTLYLVSQVDIASLRNTQRFISHLTSYGGLQIELVLNRFENRKLEFDEDRMTKAVGLPAKWKVPNDYASARRASNAGTPLIAEKSPIVQVLHQMARAACGKPNEADRKKGFRLFS